MAAELSHISGLWNWNGGRHRMAASEDDDSWEVRAFAEDTSNALGTTWPPRSYSCTFCHREFKTAQALGGHMNVHRRDRARLRQSSQVVESSSSQLTVQPIAAGGGLCVYYPPISVLTQAPADLPSTSLSMMPCDNERATHNLLSSMAESPSRGSKGDEQGVGIQDESDEMDLELRLGW